MQKLLCFSFCTSFLSLIAHNTAQAEEVLMLDPVIVSGGITPIDKDKSGRAYTIISGEQLEKNQTRSVADALRQVPGLAVSRTGAYGGLTQVRMRGGEGNHVLVLIDGIEASGISSGEFDFGNLQAIDIERIEVLRGPQSSFYGSNALAGVINIITKGGLRNQWKISGQTEGGSYKTWLGGVLLQGGGENYDLSFSTAYRRSGGFSIAPGGSERDGDHNLTINSKLNIDVTDNFALDATLRFVRHKVETDAQDFTYGSPTYGWMIDTDDWSKSDDFIGSIGFTHKSLDGALTQRGRFSGNSNESINYTDRKRSSGNRGSRVTGSYKISYEFDTPAFADAHHTVSGGADWRREKFRAVTPVSDPTQLDWQQRDSSAFIGEYRVELFDQWSLNGALRRDLNDEFEDVTTYSVASSWRVPNIGTRFHASYGTGIANPTFYEQFGFIPSQFKGNPDLMPEKSEGWDIGVEQAFWNGMLIGDVTYFKQNLKDEIATEYLPNFSSHPYNQHGKSKRQGIEVSLTLDLMNGFTSTATYTWTDAKDPDGTREVRRPEHSGSVNVAYSFYEDRARVFTEAIFNGKMRDSAFIPEFPPVVTLEQYTVVNLGGSFKFNENVELFARIDNLFDEKYQEVFDFSAGRRAAFVGLRGAF